MDAAALVRIIEGKPPLMISELNAELKTNLGTSHYRRLSDEELAHRHAAVYQGLSQWLTSRDESLLRKNGEDLGRRRFSEGIPLGQVVLTLILVEKHLWEFLQSSGQQVDESFRHAITEFFQKDAYFTAKGFESALAMSNNRATKATGTSLPSESSALKPPPKKEPAKDEPALEISRGGQVGELGG